MSTPQIHTAGPGNEQEKQEWATSPARSQYEGAAQASAFPGRRSRGTEKTSIAQLCSWVVDHQIGIAVTLLSSLVAIHLSFPNARHHTSKFYRISYYNPVTGKFAIGWDDLLFVFFWIIVLSGARCATMDYILDPLAFNLGIRKKKLKVRFTEQAWITMYYGFIWMMGMYVVYNSEYWLDLRALWRNWPTREIDGLTKWYYLVGFSFYLQQIVVVNIEERRKDHWQMFTHHIITCTLIFSSYGYHQTKVGSLIMCLMDFGDIFFSVAKILKYLHFQRACDIMFGVFMIAWFICRHVIYMTVCWSIWKHIPEEIQYGCYSGSDTDLQGPVPVPDDWSHLIEPFHDPVGLVCWNSNIQWTFLGMLLSLQAVLLMWFVMILRVAYKVISGTGAEDVRSDSEEGDEEPDDEEPDSSAYMDRIHTCVEPHPVLSTDFSDTSTKSSSPVRRSSRRKESGHSSGVNLLAAGDRRELLGRIGCDKPTSK